MWSHLNWNAYRSWSAILPIGPNRIGSTEEVEETLDKVTAAINRVTTAGPLEEIEEKTPMARGLSKPGMSKKTSTVVNLLY